MGEEDGMEEKGPVGWAGEGVDGEECWWFLVVADMGGG